MEPIGSEPGVAEPPGGGPEGGLGGMAASVQAFESADAALRAGRTDEALDRLRAVQPSADTPVTAMVGFHADAAMADKRFGDAEKLYREVLRRSPDSIRAHRQLAWLYNRQGRRHAAVVHLRAMTVIGDIRDDELFALLSIGDALYADPDQPRSEDFDPSRAYFPIGPLADARRDFGNFRFVEALNHLKSIDPGERTAEVDAFELRLCAASQRFDSLEDDLRVADPEVRDHSDFWAAATMLELEAGRPPSAIRAALETLQRDPTDYRTGLRLQTAYRLIGDDDGLASFEPNYLAVRESISLGAKVTEAEVPDPVDLHRLADRLLQLNRPVESWLWRAIAVARQGGGGPAGGDGVGIDMSEIKSRFAAAVAATGGRAPSPVPDRTDRYPLPPYLESSGPVVVESADAGASGQETDPAGAGVDTAPDVAPETSADTVVMSDVADRIGVATTFRVDGGDRDDGPRRRGFAIHQQMGGGVTIADMDADGHDDLYFAQGGTEVDTVRPPTGGLMYRASGSAFVDVTAPSGVDPRGYTLGVTAGDVNGDGWTDLAAATTRSTTLFINRGDGTFERLDLDDRVRDGGGVAPGADVASGAKGGSIPGDDVRVPVMRSSLAIADLDGDSIADVYQARYTADPNFPRPAADDGRTVEQLSPLNFRPAEDLAWFGRPDAPKSGLAGGRADWAGRPATGLGMLAAGFPADGRGSDAAVRVFVANDVALDHWLAFDRSVDRVDAVDSALAIGVALGGRGNPTGSMGVALGDLDGGGTPDLVVTNFEDEFNSVFLSGDGRFRERGIATGVGTISRPHVGFGVQALDVDGDGDDDLAIANGRVEQPDRPGRTYKQPTQILTGGGGRFTEVAVEDASGYFGRGHSGRSLAVWDRNNDGRPDLVITHVEEPAAVLDNRTPPADPDRPFTLTLRLVGTDVARDPVGASATVTAGERSATDWWTAGDGYLCRNDPRLRFRGLPPTIDAVSVRWPDGTTQSVEIEGPLRPDDANEWLVVQGQPAFRASNRSGSE